MGVLLLPANHHLLAYLTSNSNSPVGAAALPGACCPRASLNPSFDHKIMRTIKVTVLKVPLLIPGALPDVPRAPTMEYRVEPGRQGRYVIRSCFGGSNAAFIASGAEARPSWPYLSVAASAGLPIHELVLAVGCCGTVCLWNAKAARQ